MHTTNTQKIYQIMLETAATVSPKLYEAVEVVGRVDWSEHSANDLVEFMSRAVVGQQLSTKVSSVIWSRLCDAAAEREEYWAHFISEATPDDLRKLGLSRSKVKTIKGIVEASAAGKLDEDHLAALTHTQRAQELSQLWGVGAWTVNVVSMFYFREPDVWPFGDLTVSNMIRTLSNDVEVGDSSVTDDSSRLEKSDEEIAAIIDSFKPYRTYLAILLWRFADRVPGRH